jgi:hypothetical protein
VAGVLERAAEFEALNSNYIAVSTSQYLRSVRDRHADPTQRGKTPGSQKKPGTGPGSKR